MFMEIIENTYLKPFLKWPGGKSRELKHIIPNLPEHINNYYEPFVGGGAVYFSVGNALSYYINDKSKDLIDLYVNIKTQNENNFIRFLNEINSSWGDVEIFFNKNSTTLFSMYTSYKQGSFDKSKLIKEVNSWVEINKNSLLNILPNSINIASEVFISEAKINLSRKMSRMFAIEQKKGTLSNEDVYSNILTSLKSALYMYYRFLHNNQQKLDSVRNSSVYYFIRNYTYSSMFRYNNKGDFNVPYGGMGYNNNNLNSKISYLKSDGLKSRLNNTVIENLDFFDFFSDKNLNENDFIFLDPPYDTEFSTYDKNKFDLSDQKRLSDFLINTVNCKWMLVIKNTDYIHSLYDNNEGVYVNYFDKKYAVSFMNRNDKQTEHLLITNYVISKS